MPIDKQHSPEAKLITDFKPFPGMQTEILRRSEREIGIGGPRYGGKSLVGLAWMCEPEYINNPRFEGLVIRKHSTDLGEWIRRFERFSGFKATGNPKVFRLPAGGTIETGHLADDDAFEKYQGGSKQKILIEELTQISEYKRYNMLISCCRRGDAEGIAPQIMSMWNWGGPGHAWVKNYFHDLAYKKTYTPSESKHRPSTRIYLPLTIEDNPAALNDPEYIDYLESLDEPLRSAWRWGKPDLIISAFFYNFGPHLSEDPYDIPPHIGRDRLYGSMDYGDGREGVSSYGMWFMDDAGIPHRLFSWYVRGMVASEQADDLFETIQSFHETSGVFPRKIWYDSQMDVKPGTERNLWSPIEYFKDRFSKGKQHTIWENANKKREAGWAVMRNYFGRDVNTKLPNMRYWPQYNKTFEELIPIQEANPNNPNEVLKGSTSHIAEECRYGLVGIKQLIVGTITDKEPTPQDMRIDNANVEALLREVPCGETGWY